MIKGIIFDWIGTLCERDKGLFPDSKKVLRELNERRYKLGMVSITKNGIEARIKEIANTGISGYFESIIVDVIKEKEQYLECMQKMRTKPRTTAIVDDRVIRGIKIGNQLGCETYWIKNGEYANQPPNEETKQPTEIIGSVKDLLRFL